MIYIPKVSVVITTKNRLSLLQRAINSVLSQSYTNLDLIVVDDGSSDGTEEFCSSQNFKYIRVKTEDSKGGNHARNLGINAAKGDFIAFCDDDDFWLPDKIEKQLKLILEKDLDFVHCGRRLEIVKGDEITYEDRIPSSNSDGDISRSSFADIHCVTSTLLIRKSALEKVGLFDENLKAWQEHELVIRLSQSSFTDSIKEPLVVYRVDVNDSQRLTNKYQLWKDSVKYIKRKHSALISKLTTKEKLRFEKLIAADGIGRAQASGLRYQWWKNRFLVNFYKLLGV